jgi:hypothetical protein
MVTSFRSPATASSPRRENWRNPKTNRPVQPYPPQTDSRGVPYFLCIGGRVLHREIPRQSLEILEADLDPDRFAAIALLLQILLQPLAEVQKVWDRAGRSSRELLGMRLAVFLAVFVPLLVLGLFIMVQLAP